MTDISQFLPRKLPKQSRGRETVRAILEAAAQVFAERGMEGTTTNQVAERAGVSIGTLYQYFPNKESLMVAMADGRTEVTLARLREQLAALSDASTKEVTAHAVRFMLQRRREVDPDLYELVATEVVPLRGQARVRAFMASAQQAVHQLVQARAEEFDCPNLELASFFVVHAVDRCVEAALQREESEDELVEEITKMVLRYLGASGRTESPPAPSP